MRLWGYLTVNDHLLSCILKPMQARLFLSQQEGLFSLNSALTIIHDPSHWSWHATPQVWIISPAPVVVECSQYTNAIQSCWLCPLIPFTLDSHVIQQAFYFYHDYSNLLHPLIFIYKNSASQAPETYWGYSTLCRITCIFFISDDLPLPSLLPLLFPTHVLGIIHSQLLWDQFYHYQHRKNFQIWI